MASKTIHKSFFRFAEFSRKPFFKFLLKRSGPYDSVVLDRSRVYILPTRPGVVFCILLLLLLVGSVNYGKSLGYMLTFLLVGIGNVSMFAIWRNLAGLRLRSGGGAPVFAGEETTFAVQLENTDASTRYSICASHNGVEYDVVDVPSDGVAQIHFKVRTQNRGLQKSGRFRLYTRYPSSLFIAWTWIELNMSALVYPKPAERVVRQSTSVQGDGEQVSNAPGQEEFAGLRDYQKGDSWRQISWKASARNDSLLIKEFTGGQPELQWIDWYAIDAAGVEERLSIMTRLVLDAEEAHHSYGLRLPDYEIAPDHGAHHYHQCLKALATHAL